MKNITTVSIIAILMLSCMLLVSFNTAYSNKMPFCGDMNGDVSVNLGDIAYLRNYLGNGGPAPVSMFDANADGQCLVNVADISRLIDYIFITYQPPTCADTSSCTYTVNNNCVVSVGCAPYTPYPGNDSVAIPVYLDNADILIAWSFGFSYTSGNIEITSIDTTGALMNGKSILWFDTVDVSAKKVLVGASALSPAAYIAPQSGGLLFNLNARILSGPVDQHITLDSSFVPPGGDFIIVKDDYSLYRPSFEPCLNYGYIEVTNLNSSGVGSLNWAIDSANANIGPDSIVFTVSGAIDLSGPAPPPITDNYTYIAGSTAPGGAHSVVMYGYSSSDLFGLIINSDNNTVEGLTIHKWDGACVQINGNNNSIINCYLNVTQTGDTYFADLGEGIEIHGDYNIIGGPNPGDRNVIGMARQPSSDAAIGIFSSKHNKIYNNHLGLSSSGTDLADITANSTGVYLVNADSNFVGDTAMLPNYFANMNLSVTIMQSDANIIANNVFGLATDMNDTIQNGVGILADFARHNTIGPDNIIAGCWSDGIYFGPTETDSNIIIGNTIVGGSLNGICFTAGIYNNRIGGYNPGEGNIIVRNGQNGIYFYSNTDSNLVIGNRIGGNMANQSDGNGDNGILLDFNSSDNLIDSNVVAFNTNDGITGVINSRTNTITRNAIYQNGGLGIDHADDDVTLNDIGDSDSGPNDFLNFPEIDSVKYNPPDSTFMVYGQAVTNAHVEAFVAHPADDTTRPVDVSGYGEAYEFIGYVDAPASGQFSIKIPKEYPIFTQVTFTATDEFGNTSEFSSNIELDQAPLIIVGYSPINLKIIDPAGDSVGKDGAGVFFNSIGDATYDESPNDSVNIAYPLIGDYEIIVVPEDDAPPGAIYSVGIRIDGSLQAIIVENADVPASGTTDTLGYIVEEGYHYDNGDATGDNTLNLLDILLLIDCIYGTGEVNCPEPYLSGDANCDRLLNLIDILYLIDHIYGNPPGSPPCPLGE